MRRYSIRGTPPTEKVFYDRETNMFVIRCPYCGYMLEKRKHAITRGYTIKRCRRCRKPIRTSVAVRR